MIILGIETSCDETACAILKKDKNRIQILSNVVSSSLELQSKYGGVVPEQAAREQIKSIIPVIKEALIQSNLYPPAIDAIAVTYGPGLLGSLLVGVETAKTLSLVWNKPLIRVNHLIGHFYANWATSRAVPTFPCLGLLVSGGHTDLLLFTNHGEHKVLGSTRDDAAGECLDKCARILGLGYPGGPILSKLAESGDHRKFPLPKPMLYSSSFDFSFSGLKTAVLLLAQKLGPLSVKDNLADLAAAILDSVNTVLIEKTLKAASEYQISQIMVAGGVAANSQLRKKLAEKISYKLKGGKIFFPMLQLCTDNAVMVAACAFYQLKQKTMDVNPWMNALHNTALAVKLRRNHRHKPVELHNSAPADPLTLEANPDLNFQV